MSGTSLGHVVVTQVQCVAADIVNCGAVVGNKCNEPGINVRVARRRQRRWTIKGHTSEDPGDYRTHDWHRQCVTRSSSDLCIRHAPDETLLVNTLKAQRFCRTESASTTHKPKALSARVG